MELSELESQLLVLQNIKSKAVEEQSYELAAMTRNDIVALEKRIEQIKSAKEEI